MGLRKRKNLALAVSAGIGILLMLMIVGGAGFLLLKRKDGTSTSGRRASIDSKHDAPDEQDTTGADPSTASADGTREGSTPGKTTANSSSPGKDTPSADAPGDVNPPSNDAPGKEPKSPPSKPPEKPPEHSEQSIAGKWMLDMQGGTYSGVSQLPVVLNKDGSIGVDQSSGLSITIKKGSYSWKSSNRSIEIVSDCEMKVTPELTAQLDVKMTGTMDSGLKVAQGTFTATGLGLFSSITDNGTFKLYR